MDPRPERVQKFVGGGYAPAVFDEVGEEVEDLRLDVDCLPASLKGPRFGVELVLPE